VIDFSSVDDIGEDVNVGGIVLEDAGLEGGVAKGEEALSILENVVTRKQFVNDLCEVSRHLIISHFSLLLICINVSKVPFIFHCCSCKVS